MFFKKLKKESKKESSCRIELSRTRKLGAMKVPVDLSVVFSVANFSQSG